VALDAANVDWKSAFLIARLAEAALARQRGDVAEAGRVVDEALPQLEAISANEPSDHVFAMQLLRARRLKAQLQSFAGRADAAGSAIQAVAIGEKLARADGATDAEIGECARAHVVSGEVADRSGFARDARSDWLRAAEMLAPRTRGSRDWRLLDPAARAAAWLGRSEEARATIERLNLLGYVPLDPWPDPDRPAGAKISDPRPK